MNRLSEREVHYSATFIILFINSEHEETSEVTLLGILLQVCFAVFYATPETVMETLLSRM